MDCLLAGAQRRADDQPATKSAHRTGKRTPPARQYMQITLGGPATQPSTRPTTQPVVQTITVPVVSEDGLPVGSAFVHATDERIDVRTGELPRPQYLAPRVSIEREVGTCLSPRDDHVPCSHLHEMDVLHGPILSNQDRLAVNDLV